MVVLYIKNWNPYYYCLNSVGIKKIRLKQLFISTYITKN